MHQEAGGGRPGVGALLSGRQPLHQTHIHRNWGELQHQKTKKHSEFSSSSSPSSPSSPLLQPSLGVSRTGKAMIFVIVGPVGPYFATGSFNPVSLLADPSFVRAWQGGVGAYKMGGWVWSPARVQNLSEVFPSQMYRPLFFRSRTRSKHKPAEDKHPWRSDIRAEEVETMKMTKPGGDVWSCVSVCSLSHIPH